MLFAVLVAFVLAAILAKLWIVLSQPTGSDPEAPEETDETGSPPAIAVTVDPPAMTVALDGSAATFLLNARLKHSDGTLVPPSKGIFPTWPPAGLPPWMTVTATPLTYEATVSLPTKAPDWTGSLSATVGAATSAPEAKLTLVNNAATWTGDRIVARHDAGKAPSVAVLTGDPSCASDQVIPFVQVALLQDIQGPCDDAHRAVVFSPSRLLILRNEVAWTSGGPPDVVDVRAEQNTGLAILRVKVWIAIDDAGLDTAPVAQLRLDAESRAEADVGRARDLLELGRTGFDVQYIGTGPTTIVDAIRIAAVGSDCLAANALAAAGSPDNFTPNATNVYYVRDLGLSERGLACLHNDNRAEEIVYVSLDGHSETTLAHEVGHVLGLAFPNFGHALATQGLDPVTNVMAEVLNSTTANGRFHFSLGQAFRMSLDDESWANQPVAPLIRPAGSLSLECQCETHVRSPCLRLGEDIVTAPGASNPVPVKQCGDFVELTQAAITDAGYALLRGRRWRDPPTTCTPVLSSTARIESGDVYLMFPNLNASGACPSWVAVFLYGRSAMRHSIPGATWTPEFEKFWIGNALTGPVSVAVKVWVEQTADMAAVEDAIDFAENVFQFAHPSGIQLNVEGPTGPMSISRPNPCVFTPVRDQAINIYYLRTGPHVPAAAAGEAAWCEDGAGQDIDYIRINAASAVKTTLTHSLGLALGLPVTTDAFETANFMSATVADSRTTFSRGQLFWMNYDKQSWIFRAGLRSGPGLPLDCRVTDALSNCPAAISPDLP
jgi:hypothetical protein